MEEEMIVFITAKIPQMFAHEFNNLTNTARKNSPHCAQELRGSTMILFEFICVSGFRPDFSYTGTSQCC